MCDFASFIVTKNNVYYKKGMDSHEDLIQYFGLEHLDNPYRLGENGLEPNVFYEVVRGKFVKCE